jgi:chromosome segregation ATPase
LLAEAVRTICYLIQIIESNGKERKRSVGGQNNNNSTNTNNQTFNGNGGFTDHLQGQNPGGSGQSPNKFVILSPPMRQ